MVEAQLLTTSNILKSTLNILLHIRFSPCSSSQEDERRTLTPTQVPFFAKWDFKIFIFTFSFGDGKAIYLFT